MPLVGLGPYNRNQLVKYPLDDAATAVSDAGLALPAAILADLNLRWPSSLGAYAFLSALSVTPKLVTLVIQAAVDLTGSSTSPLAVISVSKPQAQVVYRLLAQAPGVAGQVVFGPGAGDTPWQGSFSTPRQGLLAAKAARPCRQPGVTGLLSAQAGSALTGIVTLRSTPPLEIVKEQLVIDGQLRNCIVFNLVDTVGAEGLPVPAAAAALGNQSPPSIFETLAGPCAGAAESGTCGDPQPLEFIAGVGPDGNGVLALQFTGCAELTQLSGAAGAVINCKVGLNDCPPKSLPSNGRLPELIADPVSDSL